jgi:hypothetical protein
VVFWLECLANGINWQPAEVRTQLVVVRFFGCDLPLLIALEDLKQETFCGNDVILKVGGWDSMLVDNQVRAYLAIFIENGLAWSVGR